MNRFSQEQAWRYAPLLVAIALFLPGVIGAGFVADDAFNLAEHARHGDLAGEWTTPTYAHAGGERGHIWRPIPATLQHLVAIGLERAGWVFRGLNLLIHGINIVLIGWLARRVGTSPRIAAILALLFTVHPAVPEAVCWSSDIYDLMATTMVLIATGIAISSAFQARHWIALAGIALLGGLCKESAVAMVPAVAIAGAGFHSLRRGLYSGIATGAGTGAYLFWHGQITAQGYSNAIEQTPITDIAQAAITAIGWWLVTPARASMAHLAGAGDASEFWTGLAVMTGAIIACIVLWRRHEGAGRALSSTLLASLALLGPAAVAIPFIGVAPLRYVYGPLALLLALMGAAFTRTGATHRAWWLLAGAIFLSNGTRSALRVGDWQSDATLWAAELQREPENAYAMGSLARAMVKEGRVDEAMKLWEEAIERAPTDLALFDQQNERWLLAQTAFLKGRPEVALRQVQQLLAGGDAPAQASCLLADSLDALGRAEEASAAAVDCHP